jgi:outer membrane lipopolysaccharide assembly protein LptE/RlpB
MIKNNCYKKQETMQKAKAKSLTLQAISNKQQGSNKIPKFWFLLLVSCIMLFSSCGIYTFRDVSIPPEVKTIRISYIENKARIVNPQLSPRLTDALQQKIANQTKLTRTASDDAHYQISGAVTNYSVSTVGVSGRQTNQNQLTIGVHIVFRNTLQNKTDEFDVSREFPFSASQTLDQAVNQQFPDILKNLTDEIFNHIFSNW